MKYLIIALLSIFALEFIGIPIYSVCYFKKHIHNKNSNKYDNFNKKMSIVFLISGIVGILLLIFVFFIWRIM